jgi:hypothetical protein
MATKPCHWRATQLNPCDVAMQISAGGVTYVSSAQPCPSPKFGGACCMPDVNPGPQLAKDTAVLVLAMFRRWGCIKTLRRQGEKLYYIHRFGTHVNCIRFRFEETGSRGMKTALLLGGGKPPLRLLYLLSPNKSLPPPTLAPTLGNGHWFL